MSPRIKSGIVLAAIVLVFLIWIPSDVLKTLIALLAGMAALEVLSLLHPQATSAERGLASLGALIISLAWQFYFLQPQWILLAHAFWIMLNFMLALRSAKDLGQNLKAVGAVLFSGLYIATLFSCLGLLLDRDLGRAWLALTLLGTFAGDTGAYAFGRLWGRHKLAPRISPGKTWEGWVGGIILSFTLILMFKLLFFNNFTIFNVLVMTFFAGVIGPLGDLSESLIKRAVGVKDSGKLIPGHGGLLDRIDALMFVAPCMLAYSYWI